MEDRLQLAGREGISEIDAELRRGAFEAAECQYAETLNSLRQRAGPTGIDVPWVLDHIGNAYLEIRDFDKAFQNFSEAVRINARFTKCFGRSSC
jgi:tetratricopeptide (TPR) repeat protein